MTEPSQRHLFRLIVPPIILPVFLSAADATVVAIALPAIAASFGHVDHLSWIVIGNLVASTVAAPAYGQLGDIFGRRRMMIVALGIFMAAAALCAFAPNFWLLLGARMLQGLGGGGLMTLAQALIGENVPPRQRGTYQGYLSANIVAGTTIGPVIGGFITQAWGWQAVFLAYLPLGLVAIGLLLRLPAGARGRRGSGVDLSGMVLLTGFIVPLLLMVSAPDTERRRSSYCVASVTLSLNGWQTAAGAAWQTLDQREQPSGDRVWHMPLGMEVRLDQAVVWLGRAGGEKSARSAQKSICRDAQCHVVVQASRGLQ